MIHRDAICKGADWWAEQFTPEWTEPWRADPAWQAAMRDVCITRPGDSAASQYERGVRAVGRRYAIEAAWEGRQDRDAGLAILDQD